MTDWDRTEADTDLVPVFLDEFLSRIRRGEAPRLSEIVGERQDLIPKLQHALSTMDFVGRALPSGPLGPGSTLGDYTLVRELGRGGMGVVFEARQRNLSRRVALKLMMGPTGVSDTLFQRFRREGELASRLEHPGICTVHDAGVVAGIPFIAMALVDGRSLSEIIGAARRAAKGEGERTALTPTTAIRWIEDAARALHSAHEIGVVHRDVKPGNIMITSDSRPVILDFGLAAGQPGPDEVGLTQTGEVFGTPAYMAPEQVDGQPADRRTDVWALGATLYEAVTLTPPFQGPTRERLFEAIRHTEPLDPGRVVRSLPRSLSVVLSTALQKSPTRRYATAQDFAEDLRRVRSGEPPLARPVPPWVRVAAWARRRPAVAALLLTLAIALPTVAALATHAFSTRDQVALAERVTREQQTAHAVEQGFALLLDQRASEAEADFRRALAITPGDPEAIAGLGWSLLDQGKHEAVLALRTQHSVPDPPRAVLVLEANALKRTQAVEQANQRAEEAGPPTTPFDRYLEGMAAMSRAQDGDPAGWTEAQQHLSLAIQSAPAARRAYHLALLRAAGQAQDRAIVERSLTSATYLWPNDPAVFYWAGTALDAVGEHDRAAAWLRRAADAAPDNAGVRAHLIQALRYAGRIDEAQQEGERAVKTVGDSAAVWAAVGAVADTRGDTAAARAAYQRALDLDPRFAVAHNNLGRLHLYAEEWDEALNHFEAAMAIDPNYRSPVHGRAIVKCLSDRADEALPDLEALLAKDPGDTEVRSTYGRCLSMLGRHDEAVTSFRAALLAAPNEQARQRDVVISLLNAERNEEALKEVTRFLRPHLEALDGPTTSDPDVRAQARSVLKAWLMDPPLAELVSHAGEADSAWLELWRDARRAARSPE